MTVATPTTALEQVRARAAELLSHDRWSREQVIAYQDARLRELLRHAVERSPYYREALGADAPERPLESLPTLSKPLLMEQFDRIVTDERLRRVDLEAFLDEADAGAAFHGDYRVFSTSGTSGIPGLFVYTHAELAGWVAVALAALARIGVGPDTRFVAIGAPSALHITRQQFASMQSARPEVPRLTALTPMPELVDALNRYEPEAILAYASIVAALADEQLDGHLAVNPRFAICTSEVLTDEAAARIEAAWGIRPLNGYAATEAAPMATGSPDAVGMHVWENVVVLEVVDEEGRPTPPGEPGAKVLLTNLVNRAQPLIRYELPDSLVVADGPDPVWRPWTRILRVDGRSDDTLRLPGRHGGEVLVHPFRLRSPFARMTDVRGYQIVRRPDELLVRVVPRGDADRELPARVETAVGAALVASGADVPVRVELVGEIDGSPARPRS